MKRLSKILVPTDLSEKSVRALHYGCWLAATVLGRIGTLATI